MSKRIAGGLGTRKAPDYHITSDKGSDGTLVRQIQGDSYGVDISSNFPPPGSVFEVIFVVAAD